MLNLLKKIFRIKLRELEAKLDPTPDCTHGGRGEVEIESWSDGSVGLEVSIKHTGLPDGTQLEVICGGEAVSAITVRGGYAKEKITFTPEDQTTLRDCKSGDEAEMQQDGQALYRGTFRRD
ncbi:MAG: hypothetical protein OER86_03720 [Phycisphaerae bacterium]|nr:hypothetical protein [Phycisphaerae bacterium]